MQLQEKSPEVTCAGKRAKMLFGEWVRALRTKRGWSQDEMARRADIARLTVLRTEKLTEPIVSDLTLNGIASAFGWTVSELRQEWERAKGTADLPPDHARPVQTDLIALVNPEMDLELGEGFVLSLVDDPEAFGYVVEGDVMAPEYKDGDIVVCSPTVRAGDGEDAFVETENGTRHFRKIFRNGPNLILQSYKPGVPVILPANQANRISGVILSIRR